MSASEDTKIMAENLTLALNEKGKPPRGSFEIFVQKSDKKDTEGVQVWSGKNKGPPRKDKFPEASAIIDDIKKALI